MRELSLFDRIESAKEGVPTVSNTLDPSLLLDNILTNLKRIMNSREGCSLTRPDYGLPDMNSLVSNFDSTITGVIRAVKVQIERFEPRLKNVVVRHVPDTDNPLNVNFRISATVVIDDRGEKISFETVVADTGRVNVRN